eukprot:3669631-Ditylum_brightwellii.AAC.1
MEAHGDLTGDMFPGTSLDDAQNNAAPDEAAHIVDSDSNGALQPAHTGADLTFGPGLAPGTVEYEEVLEFLRATQDLSLRHWEGVLRLMKVPVQQASRRHWGLFKNAKEIRQHLDDVRARTGDVYDKIYVGKLNDGVPRY